MNKKLFLLCGIMTGFLLLVGCVSPSSSDPPVKVKLRKASYVTPPLESGRPNKLNLAGTDFMEPMSEALCRLPAGSEFLIDKFVQNKAGGWYSEYAVGRVRCGKKEYEVELNLRISENAGIKKAITDEITKPTNRFWTR